MHCLICNETVDPGRRGFGWFQAVDSSEPHLTPRYVVHDACAHRAAHPEFDFAAVARAREEVERFIATALPTPEPEP